MCQSRDKETIWEIISCEGVVYLKYILAFLMKEFCRIFGTDTMFNERCIVFNDFFSDRPMLILNCDPIAIRLAQPSLSHWAQTIYQLSHELCHYAIRQRKSNKGVTLAWFEEPICEAVSLYFLNYCAANWSDCMLFYNNPSFSKAISDYLQNELMQERTDGLKSCDTYVKLAEREKIVNDDRAGHRSERNMLYYEIVQQPLSCAIVGEYQKYIDINKPLLIDFERWEKENNNSFVSALRSIQPII